MDPIDEEGVQNWNEQASSWNFTPSWWQEIMYWVYALVLVFDMLNCSRRP